MVTPVKKNIEFNRIVLTVSSLIVIGIIILASVSTTYSQEKLGIPNYFLSRQLIYLFVGIFAALFFYKINIEFLKKYSFHLFFVNIVLLAAVFIPQLGFGHGGARRWLNLGPVMIQPAEFLKLTFIVFFAAFISEIMDSRQLGKKRKKNKTIPINRNIAVSIVLFFVTVFILYKQPDLSNLGIIVALFLIMIFLSGIPIKTLLILAPIPIVALLYILKVSPHVLNRILVFMDPGRDPMGIGYQIKQATIAIGSGGLFGLGLGMSKQKLFLPETMGDSIFATFAEETGFLGSFLLLSIFIVFLWTGFQISRNASCQFKSLVAVGLTSWIIIQAFVNMGAMLEIMPLTGVTLPFISYGGSHLIAEMMAVGLLLNIAKNNK